jgi:hypothetical protein
MKKPTKIDWAFALMFGSWTIQINFVWVFWTVLTMLIFKGCWGVSLW